MHPAAILSLDTRTDAHTIVRSMSATALRWAEHRARRATAPDATYTDTERAAAAFALSLIVSRRAELASR